jgi:hypothetical protein
MKTRLARRFLLSASSSDRGNKDGESDAKEANATASRDSVPPLEGSSGGPIMGNITANGLEGLNPETQDIMLRAIRQAMLRNELMEIMGLYNKDSVFDEAGAENATLSNPEEAGLVADDDEDIGDVAFAGECVIQDSRGFTS